VVLHDRNDPERQAKRLVLLFGKRVKDDDDPTQPPEILVAADQTDSSGRVRLEVPAITFAELQLEVLGDKSDARRTVLA
jgi:hypothetical protein